MGVVAFDGLSDVHAFNWVSLLAVWIPGSCPSKQLKLLAEMRFDSG